MNQSPRCEHSAQPRRACLREGPGASCPRGVAGSGCLGKRRRVVRQPAPNHPGGHPGVGGGACAGHRPRPGSRDPHRGRGPAPPRDPRLPTDRPTATPAPPHRPRDAPQLPGPARQARAPAPARRPRAPPRRPRTYSHRRGGKPGPAPQATSAIPGADPITGRPPWLRLPGPAPARPPPTARRGPAPASVRLAGAARPRAPPAALEATRHRVTRALQGLSPGCRGPGGSERTAVCSAPCSRYHSHVLFCARSCYHWMSSSSGILMYSNIPGVS